MKIKLMDMNYKECFKCKRILPLSRYYKHPQMGDGHLNKCIDCAKMDSNARYNEKIEDPEFLLSERSRSREKYHRLGYGNKYNQDRPSATFLKNTHRRLLNIGFNMDYKEAHHWNYLKPNDIFILNRRAHKVIHKHITIDEASQCFIYNGELLDTKDKHRNFIKKVFEDRGLSYVIEECII